MCFKYTIFIHRSMNLKFVLASPTSQILMVEFCCKDSCKFEFCGLTYLTRDTYVVLSLNSENLGNHWAHRALRGGSMLCYLHRLEEKLTDVNVDYVDTQFLEGQESKGRATNVKNIKRTIIDVPPGKGISAMISEQRMYRRMNWMRKVWTTPKSRYEQQLRVSSKRTLREEIKWFCVNFW